MQPVAMWQFAGYRGGILPETRMRATPQPVIERVFRKLGGRQALGTDVSSEADLARVVHHGIRLGVLSHVQRAGFSKQEIELFIIPARTWRHRKAKRESLTIEESDRVV